MEQTQLHLTHTTPRGVSPNLSPPFTQRLLTESPLGARRCAGPGSTGDAGDKNPRLCRARDRCKSYGMLQRVVLWRKLKQGKGQEGAGSVVIRWPGRASRRRARPEDEGAGAAGSGQQNSQRPGERLPPMSEETHGGQSGGKWTGRITRGPGPWPEVRLSREDSERSLQPEQPHSGCLADSRLLP